MAPEYGDEREEGALGGSAALHKDLQDAPELELDFSWLDEEKARRAGQQARERTEEVQAREQAAQQGDETERRGADADGPQGGGGAGGSGGGSAGSQNSAPSDVAPSTQDVAPQNDADDEQSAGSAEPDEEEEAAEEAAEPEATEPAPAPPRAPVEQPEVDLLESPPREAQPQAAGPMTRHPLAGRVVPSADFLARKGAQVNLPADLVEGLRELLTYQGHEELAGVGRNKIVTAFLAASMGVDLADMDQQTEELLDAFRTINPVLGSVESSVQSLVEQNEELLQHVVKMHERVRSTQSVVMTTEMSAAYLVAHSTAELPTKNVTPENVDIAQPRTVTVRDRARDQTGMINRLDAEKKGRPIK